MPPTIPNRDERAMRVLLANPAQLARTLAQQQQGGTSGTIPGTSSPVTQVATRVGVIQEYPAVGSSPNGDGIAGVGHQVLGPDGNPIAVLGNLAVTQAGNAYDDRGVALLDANGNVLAWHSPTDGPQHLIQTNPQSGDYTFTIHDLSKVVESTGSSAQTFTIDTLVASGIPLGAFIEICQVGSGALTIATAGGVTLLPSGATGPSGQGQTIGIRQRQTANEWVMTGAFH